LFFSFFGFFITMLIGGKEVPEGGVGARGGFALGRKGGRQRPGGEKFFPKGPARLPKGLWGETSGVRKGAGVKILK